MERTDPMETNTDGDLEAALTKAGAALEPGGLAEFLAGVNAAPESHEADAWMSLLLSRPSSKLSSRLRTAKENIKPSDAARQPTKADRKVRLQDLRTELMRRGLDGFIVPRGDEHQGEYVAKRSERLSWLTGFTGSAGAAVVLMGKAAVFVDGRYTLQAADQVDGDQFEVCHLMESPPTEWITAALPKDAKLGFDPWLHSPVQVARFRQAAAKAGAELVAVDGNPIDAVWPDQPPAPIAPVVPHLKTFTGEGSSSKRVRLATGLKNDGIRAVALSQPDSIAWLLNVRGGDVPCTPLPLSFAILYDDASVDWFLDARKLDRKLARQLHDDIRVLGIDDMGGRLDELGTAKARVALDPGVVPMWIASRLEQAGAQVQKASDPCQLPKACKNKVELACTRDAHIRDAVAMIKFLIWFEQTAPSGELTELDAVDRLAQYRAEGDHFRDLSFDTIAGSGPNGAIIHYRATEETNRRIGSRDILLLDSGGQYLDGTTDITRTIAVGRPKKEVRDRFTRVLKGHIALARAIFPKGTTGTQLDTLARSPLWEVGLDYDHGTGHGVGSYLSVHEGPQRIAKAPSAVPLQPGMILSNEPGYYKPGAYGIRIENLVAVKALDEGPKGGERDMLGFETLTLVPIDRSLIDPELLDESELAWLNAYHKRVWDTLKPLVEKKARTWLKHATRKIRPA